ncbi:MAG: hypothetical protein SPI30_08590 [Prevotella sp.]|nr:hypothetical protein [Prevotella sp.]
MLHSLTLMSLFACFRLLSGILSVVFLGVAWYVLSHGQTQGAVPTMMTAIIKQQSYYYNGKPFVKNNIIML